MTRRPTPISRMVWHNYYAARFNKTEDPNAAHLAMWYLLLHLAFDEVVL